MNQQGGLVSRLATESTPLVALGVIACFSVALFGVLRIGLPIWSLLVAIAAVMYVLLTLQRPTFGLVVVICVFFLPVRLEVGFSLLQAVGMVTAGLLLIWFLHQQRTIYLGNILLPLFLLGIFILISFMFTLDSALTTKALRKWIFNMAFVVLLMNMVTRFDILKKVIWAVIIMAVLNATVGMLTFGASAITSYRSVGLLENANHFGHLAALAFPLALYQYLYRSGFIKWLGLGLSALLVGGVVVSVSRGAVVSLVLVFLAIFITERRRIIPLLLVAALALCAVPFAPAFFHERVGNLASDIQQSLFLGEKGNLTSRGYLNKAGIRMWMSHPVLGVGIGNFGHYYVQKEFNPGHKVMSRYTSHNIYLQALAEMGTVGFLLLIWLIVATMKNIIQARRASSGDKQLWMYFGAIQMMAIAIFISTASHGSILNSDFWLLVSLPAVGSRLVRIQDDMPLMESALPKPAGNSG